MCKKERPLLCRCQAPCTKALPWARPGLVQFVRVLRQPVAARIHVTAATIQLKATAPCWCLWHELAEDAHAAMPEGGLRKPPHHTPCPGLWVIRLHHVREFKCIVISPRDIELASQDGQAAPNMYLQVKAEE